MALSKEIYAAFEAVVGKNNISQDPGVLQTYRCKASQSSAHYGPYNHITPMPQAVILPGSTKEVQGVVRLCNKYKIEFKASTTFWSAHGYISSDNAVQLDMRRMKNFTIDPKNMVAQIEPYVIGATLQAEAMKYGLTCNIPGVGCSSSTLASTSGWTGGGPISVFAGVNYENFLCAEWVLPTGDIVYSGTAGAGGDWSCGEGPGPSLRACFKGSTGQTGDFGVCTRISVKLSPWPGPKYLPSTGYAPVYLADLPENFRAYCICFPNWDSWAKAVMKINDNYILYIGHRQFSMFGNKVKGAMLKIITDQDLQLCDLPALMEDPETDKFNKSIAIEAYIVLAGFTPDDLAWKEAALDEILKEFGGWKDEWFLEKDHENYLLTYLIRLGHKNLNYVLCGSYEGHYGLCGHNQVVSASVMEEASAIREKAQQEGTYMAATGGDSMMGSLAGVGGGGGPMGCEFFMCFDAHDPKSVDECRDFIDNVSRPWSLGKGFGMEMCNITSKMRLPDAYSYTQEEQNAMYKDIPGANPFVYQWYMREAFNPNHLCSSYYQTCDPKAVEKK